MSSLLAWWRIAPVLCLGLTVLTTNILTPTLVGTYVDSFGLSVGQAGYTAAAYMFGGGLGGVLVSCLLLRVPTRIMLIIGLLLLSLGNFASIFIESLPSILSVRMITGIGEGIGFGLMGACISRLPNPGRIYGVFTVLLLLIAASILYALPALRSHLGPRMILLPIAVAPACLLVTARNFPSLANPAQTLSPVTVSTGRATVVLRVWLAPLATFVIYVAYGAEFAYTERLGVYAGIAADSVSRMLAMGSLVALVGAVLATVLAGARAVGLKIGTALAIVICCTWALVAGKPALYWVGVVLMFGVWSFFVPTLMGLVFLLDRNGRLAAAALGAMEWGMALGPAIAAFGVTERNLDVIGPLATLGFCAGLILLIPAIRDLSRRRIPIQPVPNTA